MSQPVAARRSRLAVLAFVACVTGCVALGPRLAPPTVTVDEVRLERIEGAEAQFAAAVTLDNPNDRDVVVDSLDATLSLEGEAVARFALAAPVTLPAHGRAPAAITARAGMDAFLRGVANAMRRSAAAPVPELRYELAGQARLAGGLLVPFRRTGQLGSRARPAS